MINISDSFNDLSWARIHSLKDLFLFEDSNPRGMISEFIVGVPSDKKLKMCIKLGLKEQFQS